VIGIVAVKHGMLWHVVKHNGRAENH